MGDAGFDISDNRGEDLSLSPPVRFYVTGFGPFQNVPSNPTLIMVNKLQSYLRERQSTAALAMCVQNCWVLETSAQAARRIIDALYTSLPTTSSTKSPNIVLHLGVAYNSRVFKLEQCAYNDAHFRVPDERGYNPVHERVLLPSPDDESISGASISTSPVDTSSLLPWNACLGSTVDVPDLYQRLVQRVPQYANLMVQSNDPGRFVCNYTYCYSLSKANACQARCMFLHVPTFQVVPETAQLAFIADVMECLYEQAVADVAASGTN